MDRGWKAELIAAALSASPAPAMALDLACGTGDLAIDVARAVAGAQVVGVDASREMITLACGRIAAEPGNLASRVTAVPGDLGTLPAATASADLVTAGYAFRNGPPLALSLAEAARVLKPGGIIATLDFYRPASALWRTLFLAYLKAAGNVVGWWWHREPVVYGYIAESISVFVTADEFSAALRTAGFEPLECKTKLGGGVALHLARRA
jgi:demethylmenaquinone methyltransferase/2-methoxy-6-polyprenyl-1,4-benzoquinol methylase